MLVPLTQFFGKFKFIFACDELNKTHVSFD
jgi:hypothetical protein